VDAGEPLATVVEGSGATEEKVESEVPARIVPEAFDSSMEVLSFRFNCPGNFSTVITALCRDFLFWGTVELRH